YAQVHGAAPRRDGAHLHFDRCRSVVGPRTGVPRRMGRPEQGRHARGERHLPVRRRSSGTTLDQGQNRGRPVRRTVALTVGAMVAVLACGPAAAGNRPATRADHRTGPRIRPLPAWATGVRWHGRVAPAARDQVLVRFYAAAGEPERRAALDRVRGVIESTLELAGAVVVRLPAGASIEDAVDRLTRVRAVEWAEPNLVRTALQYPVPDDHYYQGPAFPMQR